MSAPDVLTRMFVAKDFKGKGLAEERRAVASELARVVEKMHALADEAERVLTSTPFRLRYSQLAGKHREAYHVMRWRFQSVGSPWATWQDVCAASSGYPALVRQVLLRIERDRISLVQTAKALRTLHCLLEEGAGLMEQACRDLDQWPSQEVAGARPLAAMS
ncbi:hypothetical protein LA03_06075 [Burkholderia gladioli]|uniref:DUF3158 family protein n=1 Tax=Burkholderia gladioli TaxID=28095 RepID=UPI00051041AE|nr:DUF3158 family protein [Burkholderia gladioli]KGE11133.1 hypothetical protein LA03_06075 [Burkholderia gladioli]MBU9426468.1 hypothetical protein [Burkholderia gladioli]MDN7919291.1 DUF3158 family protein [Burkholderia gladioli]MDN8063429.1 DUF3158 family protein [Burkholderia gladioli]